MSQLEYDSGAADAKRGYANSNPYTKWSPHAFAYDQGYADAKYERPKMLTISTGHLTDDTCNEFLGNYEHAYDKGEFGCFVYVDTEARGLPASLEDCLGFAEEQGCAWVVFDCDGPILPELTFYEW